MVLLIRRTVFPATRTSIFLSVRYNSDTTKRNFENLNNPDQNKQEIPNNIIEATNEDKPLSGFGKAFVKLSKLVNQPLVDESDLKFTTLLRHSKLMQVNLLK